GNLNPIRYRGYYYDVETGLYFLKTRYYDPQICRFITIDDIQYLDPEHINGLNLYAYCGDNPVMGYDPNGTWDWKKFWGWLSAGIVGFLSIASIVVGGVLIATGVGAGIGAILVGAGVGGLIGLAGSIVGQGITKGWSNIDGGLVAISGIAGLAIGALMASPLNAVVSGIVIGSVGFTQSVVNDLYENNWNFRKVNWGIAVLQGVSSGLISGAGKFLAHSTQLMNKFINSSKAVQELATLSIQTGTRASYFSYWMQIIVHQTIYKKGFAFLTGMIRAGIRAIIDLFN
ncbi:MAG: hypothetical protein HFK10_06055, partial [Clostridia bacterium]|nr:hypothetical protein [Clostridia bacterium]